MNKTRYRIVFNKARGCLMAVAETAIAQGKGASGATTCGAAHPGLLRLSVLGLVCKWLAGTALVCLPLAWLAPLQAQTVATRIVADHTAPSAQRPTVLTTSNGVVQVDIRTPSAAGVSRNTYSQFDVGAAGAVLNNSRTPVQTQQGGWVQGNPWLATGSARVILNEVNSSNPSYLQGYVEVAGQRAQVIIANPSGIAINGGGFINASTATLTTGTAIMNAGALESFRVQGGLMTIDGQGLDARSTDYTAILSRALQVNAGIWAQQLQVVTGANDIAAASVSANTTLQTTPLAGAASPPSYALDVAALGGMYAGKIHLIGTEVGVGVRNAGLLQASSGPLTLSHQGWLSNSGTLQASGGDVIVQTQGTMAQSGTVYSDRNVQLNAQASQTHSGVVAALGNVQIQAKDSGASSNTGSAAPQILANTTTVWAAGMRADGSLETLPAGDTTGGQTLRVYADGLLQTAGQALATEALSLQAASLDVSQSRQQAPSIQMQATTGDLQATGSRILAAQTLHMQTAQTLTTDRAQLQADTLTLQAQALSNVAGQITQTGQADQSLTLQGQLNNTAGTIYSAARHLNIRAQGIDNTAGQILHAGQGTLAMDSQGDIINAVQSHNQPAVTDGARIIGSGAVQVSAQTLTNSGSIYAAQDLSSTANSLANSGSLYAGGNQALTVTNALSSSGTIAAAKDLNINAASVAGTSTNVLAAGMAADGQLSGTGTLTAVTTGALQNAGQVLATNGMSLTGSALNLAGSQTGTTAGDVSLSASSGDINTRQAQVSTPGKLTLTANSQATQKLDNSEGQISAQQLNIRVGQLVNDQGAIEQTGTGVKQALIESAGNLNNTSGSIIANAQDFTLNSGALNNTSGLIGHAGTGSLTLNAASLDNSQGQVMGNGAASINTSGDITNADGLITAVKDLSIQSADLSNTASGTRQSATGIQSQTDNLSLNTAALTNSGSIYAAQEVSTTANSLANSGSLYAGGNQALTVANSLRSSGTIAAAKDLTIQAQNLSGTSTNVLAAGMAADGQLSGTGTLTVNTSGALQSAGQVLATNGLGLTGSALNLAGSQTGTTAGDVNLTASSGDINTRQAQVSTPGQLSITANSQSTQKLDNTEGQISAQQLNIRVGQLVNDHGAIEQTGIGVQTASINTLGSLNNTSGRIVANAQDFTLNTGALTNNIGLIGHAGTGLLQVDSISLDNTQGKITGNGTAQIITSDNTTNASGLISAQQNMTLSAGGITNTQGTLASINGQVSLQSQINGLDNRQGLIQAKQNLDITLSGADNSLQNTLGQIIAGREILLSTGVINNAQGLVAAGLDLQIDIHGQTLNNQGTRSADPHAPTQGLIAGGQLVIQSGGVDNRSGLIHAQGGLVLTSTGAVNNSALSGSSQIYSGGQMTLQATGLNNTGSQILAVQSMTADVASGTIDNSQALMRTGQTLTLQAGTITNVNTLATANDGTPAPMGLEGQNVVLSASNIDNTQGAVRAVYNLNIQSDGLLHNDHGQLSAGQQLGITSGTNTPPTTAPTLRMSNDAGLVVADQSVVLRAGRLSGAGQIVSQGDVSLSLQGDHTLAGTLQAGGDLQLQTTGTLTNPVTVQAGKNLSITAGNLDNQASGQLLSAQTTTLQISNTLTNRGLIDGADTRIQGATVNNLGTGRIYGDRVAIAANTLSNQEETVGTTTRAATIAGRERVDMGVQTLTNRENALIYSGGDMALGGSLNASWRATGTAQSIHNNSATIEAAQALTIQATNIRNTNEHFASQVQQISQTAITEYQHAPGDVASASDNSTRFAASDTRIWDCESYCMTTVAGTSDAFVQYNYTRTVDASVVTQTAPGQILAGQGITMTAETVLNDKSQIVAGGTLSVQATRVDNLQGEGTQITTDAGTATSYWRARRRGRDTYGSSTGTYAPAASTQTIGLNAARYEQYAASTSTSTAPADSTLTTVQTQADATSGVTAQMRDAELVAISGAQASAAQGSNTPNQTQAGAETAQSAQVSAAQGTRTSNQAAVQSPSTQTQVRTQTWRATVPNTSLYRQHPEAGAKYLVETDPQFTQYKTWLGSDYMTAQLQFDPATSQKRMGDGFYEQKLVREQVQALTGQRFLGDYSNDQTQYMALMNNGLTYARQWNLRPGIALSAEQVAQLTSDMVWLVTQEVTLADGSKQSVLVPQVYVRVQPGDVDGTGALLAGRDVRLNLSADATNSGTIAGRNLVQINADSIQNMGGNVSGAAVALLAEQDINNIGGQIQAQSAALLSAGRDINMRTTTQSSTNRAGNNSFAQTGIDRVAGLYVSGPAGVLIASAGRDLNLTAAQISNQGSGLGSGTTLSAAQNINLATVTTSSSQDINWSGVNYLRQSASQDVGSQINTTGNLTLSAGQDINAKAATVNAGQALSVAAQRDVNITTGQTSQSLDTANTVKSKGMMSSRTLNTRQTSQSTTAVASNLEGASVSISAGQDLTVKGSNVLADQSVNLNAGRNVTIEAAQNTQSQTDYRQETKSGLMSGGGIGFTVGKRQQSLDQQGQSTSAAQSTIGAINGNVTITAGQTYTQTGSDVLTPKGDIAITAKKVDITEARETGSQSTEQKFKQSGLTVAITSPVLSALQTVQSQLQAAGNTSSGRMQLLAGANAAFNLKQGADAIKAGQGDANGMVKTGAQNSDGTPKTNADGTPETKQGNAADKAGGIGISISVGSSSSQSKQSSSADNARGSSINAGGNVSIKATGDGQNSNLTVQGSSIQAGQTTRLQADNQVNLLAAQNTTTESSSNQSKSASVGVAIQLGAGGGGMGFTASASKATGQGAGNGVTYTNTQVAGNTVNIESGGDTTLKGAVVKANQVTAQVGGNLTIQSLQDTNQYKESSKSAGGSIMVGAGVSGSINLAKSSINSTYTSVNEQSAIRAGDGGFQVEVKGNTTLTGAQITSTQAAIDKNKDNNKNSFQTGGTLTTTDLQNKASYEAKSVSVGLGAGALPGKSASAGMSGVGFGSDSGNAASTSTAGISGVAGNTAARTGDKETGIGQVFNKEQVKAEVNAQVAITNEFGKQASKAVGDYAGSQLKDLKKQADTETDPTKKAALQAEAAKWDEGGTNRVALHAVVGGLTGGASGAVGAAAASAAAPTIDQLQGQLQSKLETAGLSPEAAKALSGVVGGGAAAAVGAAASGGSTAGGATAFNADMNNRQLHPSEVQKAKDLAAKSGGKYTQKEIEDAMRNAGNSDKSESIVAGMVVDPKVRDAIYDKGAVWTMGEDGKLVQVLPPQPSAELANFIKANTGATYNWYTPSAESAAAKNAPRDRLTNLPLDDKGRYSRTVVLDGKAFEPKYLPCATVECQSSAKNLDMSDPASQAYVKALDQQVFKDIGTGATGATMATPTGAAAKVLFWVGAAASGGQAATSEKFTETAFDEFMKALSEKGGAKVFEEVLGHTPGAAARASALINLTGGWDAFVNRVKVDVFGMKSDDTKN